MEEYIGSPVPMDSIRSLADDLTSKVVEKINNSQELVMVNDYVQENNEFLIKSCFRNRISDIASWKWVLEDLSRRVEECTKLLRHEIKAINVVLERISNEILMRSRKASGVGALNMVDRIDSVEEAIMRELNFLREQKKLFQTLKTATENQLRDTERIHKKINHDIFKKDEALTVEETCSSMDCSSVGVVPCRKKKKCSTVTIWEAQCMNLKQAGLKALTDSHLTRQQMRGARTHLSIAAQSFSNIVETALRKRLHANQLKLQEIEWHREETLRDLQSLEVEKTSTEQSLLANMEQKRTVEARLVDRNLRPKGETTKDEVDHTLRIELARVRNFIHNLRCNLDDITCLQNKLHDAASKMNCVAADIAHVIYLDEKRIQERSGDTQPHSTAPSQPTAPPCPGPICGDDDPRTLNPIMEEPECCADDDDDYPFDY